MDIGLAKKTFHQKYVCYIFQIFAKSKKPGSTYYLYATMPESSAISSGYRSTFTDQLQQHTHQVQPFYGNLNLNNTFM